MKTIIFAMVLLASLGKFVCLEATHKKSDKVIKDFVLLTVPKSGTNMFAKLLYMLTQRSPNMVTDPPENLNDFLFELKLLSFKQKKQFSCHHFGQYEPLFDRFMKKHPSYMAIITIRDIRDQIISFLNHPVNDHWFNIVTKEMGYEASFEEKLTFFLDLPRSDSAMMIFDHITNAIKWRNHPNAITLRFEDFVGSHGGGSQEIQERNVISLANHLNMPLSAPTLAYIRESLWGSSGTFQKGKIGSWKRHFKPEHIKLFNEKWGALQQTLGYPLP